MDSKPMSLNTKIKLGVFGAVILIVAIATGCYYSKTFGLALLSLFVSGLLLWGCSALYTYLDNIYYFANEYRATKRKVHLWLGAICKLMEISKLLTPVIPVVMYVVLAKLV
tara:strand:+ start:2130 stop:2462 length:333 start_codon:yes stop_codon:yes gene_type:complete